MLRSNQLAVEGFGDHTELDDEVAGEVIRLDFAPLLPPQAKKGGLVIAHDDPGVRAADERAALCCADRRKPICTQRHEKPPRWNELIMIVIDAIDRYYDVKNIKFGQLSSVFDSETLQIDAICGSNSCCAGTARLESKSAGHCSWGRLSYPATD